MILRHNFRANSSLLPLARKLQEARLSCSAHFPKRVFRDSAWDILIELFIAEQEGRKVCLKEVAAIAGESATGSVRRIDELEDAGLICRRPDQSDRRRTTLLLSSAGYEGMRYMIDQLFDERAYMTVETSKV
jgi:DNA-binding MarR family transcriptional regulator